MNEQSEVRVWILSSKRSDFLNTIASRARYDDIVLQYDRDKSEITLLGGYKKDDISKVNQLESPIRIERLNEILSGNPEFLQSDSGYFLNSDEWVGLRKAIIEINPHLEEIILLLEKRQQLLPILRGNIAIIYDMVYTALKIFNHSKLKYLTDYLDNWRSEQEKQTQNFASLSDSSRDLVASLKNSGFANSISESGDEFYRKIFQTSNPSISEEDAINRDFYYPEVGLIREDGYFPPEWELRIVRIRDEETNRFLTLHLAHKKGHGTTDLSGADLIYENEDYKSIIFIQYKLRKKNHDLYVSDKAQLAILLETCQLQGCNNCINGELKYSMDMRLLDCPVYYKIIDNQATISPKNKSISGVYLQVCLACRLIEDNEGSIKAKQLERALTSSEFISLLRKSQLGSKAEAFDALRQRIVEHMKGGVTVSAVEHT